MAQNAERKYELICVVVNFGIGSKVLRAAKEHGVTGGTVLLGRGTVKSHLLELLGLTDVRKEIVLMIAESHMVEKVLPALNRQFGFAKPNHGIAFSADVVGFFGARDCLAYKSRGSTGGDEMYKAIFTVVDRGKAQAVIDAATAAGSRGATVINARGSGIHEQKVLFSMPVEPEKDIVLILAQESLVEPISAAVRKALKIDEPGMGILFILDINQTFGLL
ncbi:MAG: P-II family nitrogen regulator [Bacillota bacterium]|jgi:nitrogen regulatory protein PII|nr:P-II family nitrogen regulator [Candidatus Fermentithermobacillaceae bacterium]